MPDANFCRAAALGLLAVLAGCSPAAEPAPPTKAGPSLDAFKAAMIAEANQLTADYNSGDVGKLAAHYASDQVLMQDGGPNLDAAGAGARRKGQTSFAITLVTSNIIVDAPASQDMATVRSTCIVNVNDKTTGKLIMSQANNCLLGYRRQADGSMKVNWSLTSPTVPHAVSAPSAPPAPPAQPAPPATPA
mgnify:CR=1 FL=1